ncbi:hypothetical protein DFJ74DRAFT_121882 [Hyaloraphidium curvatum]|nr:hypothetical protein DFJ74DRAFT_121882 [Hyaloraphidium curvatum]
MAPISQSTDGSAHDEDRGKRPVRIGNWHGYAGDWSKGLSTQLENSGMPGTPTHLDFVNGDYLAEGTFGIVANLKLNGQPTDLFHQFFLGDLSKSVHLLKEKKIRMVTNAGGDECEKLARGVRDLLASKGLDLTVATVDGDALSPEDIARLQSEGCGFDNLDAKGQTLAGYLAENKHKKLLSGNAYMGGFGIAAALRGGADIVICGRVTDASLTAGIGAYWFDWQQNQYDVLASAVLVGHVIECSGHCTGGNFSGFLTLPGIEAVGYPVAELDRDGSAVITKFEGTGGAVTTDTVLAQIVYEIQGRYYLNPDATVDLSTVHLEQVGKDRVRIHGIKGLPPPPTTKVGINIFGGYELELYTGAVGLDVDIKFETLKKQVLADVADIPVGTGSADGFDFVKFELIGRPMGNPVDENAATSLVRITAQAPERLALMRLRKVASEQFLRGFPGYTGVWGPKAGPAFPSYVEFYPALLAYDKVPHRATLPDGTVVPIGQAPDSAIPPSYAEQNPPQSTTSDDFGETIRVPLGYIAHARSGDKGGNSNVGFWTLTDSSYDWLRSKLTLDFFTELLAEEGKGMNISIERIEFPNVRAVHFLIRGLLGKGCMSNMRLDMLSKSVGEYFRAKLVDVPKRLLKEAGWHPAVAKLEL